MPGRLTQIYIQRERERERERKREREKELTVQKKSLMKEENQKFKELGVRKLKFDTNLGTCVFI